jgi:hypothetical protein
VIALLLLANDRHDFPEWNLPAKYLTIRLPDPKFKETQT